MKSKNVTVNLKSQAHRYDIIIEHDSLGACGEWAGKCLLEETNKIAIVSNAKVFGLYGETVKTSLEKSGFTVAVWLMNDGERYKNFRSLETALQFFSENNLNRTDAVVALGGGVVGDLAGFAAAVYQRGLAFLQIPTTLLAMIDSSVGGKTAVNTAFGKNLIGAFHQPHGVLIDVATLKTLPRRELTAGFCEAVKQGAISGDELFRRTSEFLEKYSLNKFNKNFFDELFVGDLENLLQNQVAFKAEIVEQDERESSARGDAKSRKILNFGHTLAHALEKVTRYKRFKHGEAVGYGILFAAELSKTLDIFDNNELILLNDVLRNVGKLPTTQNIDLEDIFAAFKFDKKQTGNSLQWILLEGIGKPKIVSGDNIPDTAIWQTLKKVLQPPNSL